MIAIRALGPPDVKGADGTSVESVLAQPKRTALLVYLAMAAETALVRRDPLMALFWPEHDEGHARGSLRQALYALKQDLGSFVFATRGDDEVGLNADVVWCDVWTFRAALNAERLEEAVVLYRGDFLSGFFLKGHAAFDQWAEAQRDRLARQYAKALQQLADSAATHNQWDDAVDWSRRLASHNPYSTKVTLRLMEALAASGDRAAALECARRHAARLNEDLDAAPSPDVTALAERLRKNPTRRATDG